jgi:hypothetical protein
MRVQILYVSSQRSQTRLSRNDLDPGYEFIVEVVHFKANSSFVLWR